MSFGAECFLRCDVQGFTGRIKNTYPELYGVLRTASLNLPKERMTHIRFCHFPLWIKGLASRGVWCGHRQGKGEMGIESM